MKGRRIAGVGVLWFAAVAAGQQAGALRLDAEAAMSKFSSGDLTREELLQTLRAVVAGNPSASQGVGEYIKDLSQADDPPAGYAKPAEQRTEEERIAAWIFDLRDMRRSDFGIPSANRPSVEDRLIAAGPAALDQLIRALPDRTVTRAMPFTFSTEAPSLLRRGDLAAHIFERITCLRPGTSASEAEQASRWWEQARGKPQATGIRLWTRNAASENPPLLAQIEGSPEDIATLRALQAKSLNQYGGSVSETLQMLDRRSLVHASLDRFWQRSTQRFDLSYVSTYGDHRVYAEIARRLDARQERDLWTRDINGFSNRGGIWAIPILIATLEDAIAAPPKTNGDTVMTRAGDLAIEQLAELTKMDFGFQKGLGAASRQVAAYQKAVDWWQKEGKQAYAPKMAEARPTPADDTDLLDGEDAILARIMDIRSNNSITARRAIAGMPRTYSSEVQRALLARLTKETLPAERRLILQKFGHAALWQGPALVEVFETDSDESVRLATVPLLKSILGKTTIAWQYRLEPRVQVLAAVRRVAANPGATATLRREALGLMISWDSFEDREAAEKLAADAMFKDDPTIKAYLMRTDDVK